MFHNERNAQVEAVKVSVIQQHGDGAIHRCKNVRVFSYLCMMLHKPATWFKFLSKGSIVMPSKQTIMISDK